jgi:hypothetical protein
MKKEVQFTNPKTHGVNSQDKWVSNRTVSGLHPGEVRFSFGIPAEIHHQFRIKCVQKNEKMKYVIKELLLKYINEE